MAVVKMCRPGKSLKTVFGYITRRDKTEYGLLRGINCDELWALDDMMFTKTAWNKLGGRQYMHVSVNFHAQEQNLTPQDVLEHTSQLIVGTKAFEGFEALIAVHTDRKHLHAHVVLNTVNIHDGHKLQFSRADLQELKTRNDKMCRQKGYHVPEKGYKFDGSRNNTVTTWSKEEYQLLKKVCAGNAVSWKANLAARVAEAATEAISREEFISMIYNKGVQVNWTDKHKHLTFVDADGNKARDNKLQNYLGIGLEKEQLLQLFQKNRAKRHQPKQSILSGDNQYYLQKLADQYVDATVPGADEDFHLAFYEAVEKRAEKEGYWQIVAMLKDELQKVKTKEVEHDIMRERE